MTKIARRTLLGTAAAATLAPRARAAGQVIVGTWGGDYAKLLAQNIDKPLLEPKGIEVIQDVGGADARRTKITAERNARRGSMDVACLSDIDLYSLNALHVWEPITEQNVPNIKHVPEKLVTGYSIPHIISGKVMLYNPSKMKAPSGFIDCWDTKMAGKLGLIDIQYQYVIMLANLAHGGPMNDFSKGKAALLELKKTMKPKIYPSNEAFAVAMKGEEILYGPMWLARGVFWKNSGINIAAAYPKEGAIAYVSGAGVPKNAQNKANALAYMNAMLDPAAQVGFAKSMSYGPTVDNAPVPPDLMKEIAFTPAQQEQLKYPDFGYLGNQISGLLDWWNKEFKA
jgi:putative spermidine/putrescine transport system substrate-binding protein